VQPEETVIVRAYSDDSDDMMLMELRPRFVVMFDPSLEFLRRMEVFCLFPDPYILPENLLGLSRFKSRAASSDILPNVRGMQRRTQILAGVAKGEKCVHTTDRGTRGTLTTSDVGPLPDARNIENAGIPWRHSDGTDIFRPCDQDHQHPIRRW
jgi:hypothetical protein